MHDLLSAAGVVGGCRCFQKLERARQAAPNLSDTEALKGSFLFLYSKYKQHVMVKREWLVLPWEEA